MKQLQEKSSHSYVIEVEPKDISFDPLAQQVQASLIEAGEPAAYSQVLTKRLYRLKGPLGKKEASKIAKELLWDPIVEKVAIEDEQGLKKKTLKAGSFVDVWPKTGVTDPVGETVAKGIRDLGNLEKISISTGTRYVFPKIQNKDFLKKFTEHYLANELIHDVIIRETNEIR